MPLLVRVQSVHERLPKQTHLGHVLHHTRPLCNISTKFHKPLVSRTNYYNEPREHAPFAQTLADVAVAAATDDVLAIFFGRGPNFTTLMAWVPTKSLCKGQGGLPLFLNSYSLLVFHFYLTYGLRLMQS